MNDINKFSGNPDDIFNLDFTKDLPENNRFAVRYIRTDIKASVLKVRLFGLGKPLGLELLDISSKGALISTNKKIRKNKIITLILEFEDGKMFEISSKIVRLEKDQAFQYGIKFDRFNHDLGNYLLETQDDLVFR
jgi:c-di-GMP-binding flagellar brake protein YcgR